MNEQNNGIKYVAGIDGGGTKTACMIADSECNILSYVITDGSNHQLTGLTSTVENVTKSIKLACERAGIDKENLSYIYMGMAGADFPEDIECLTNAFSKEFEGIPYKIVNDRWNAFACEANDMGAVSICGTGSSMGVRDNHGNIYSTRSLRYILGNYGGGNHLTEMAMHYAFRCDENTGPYTKLVEELPGFCRCSSMEELAKKVYTSNYVYYKKFNIPKLVFGLASEGDAICKEIINRMGSEMGYMVACLIRKAGLEKEAIPVVLSGSLYVSDNRRQLIQPFEDKLRLTVPSAIIRIVTCPPVIGALFLALDKIGIKLTWEEKQKIKAGFKSDEISVNGYSDEAKEEE